jgi:hypothetical protein
MQLPQLSARANGFVGRLAPDEYIAGLRDDFGALPRQFGDAEDDAVLLGLGYRQPGSGAGRFDASVGAKLTWPREMLSEPRETNLGAGVALEMQFGERQRKGAVAR